MLMTETSADKMLLSIFTDVGTIGEMLDCLEYVSVDNDSKINPNYNTKVHTKMCLAKIEIWGLQCYLATKLKME